MQRAEARAAGENLLLTTWKLRSLEDNHVQINASTRWESRPAAEGGGGRRSRSRLGFLMSLECCSNWSALSPATALPLQSNFHFRFT